MMEMAVKPNTYKYPVTESKWTPPSFHSSFPKCSDTAESTKTETRHLSDMNQGAEFTQTRVHYSVLFMNVFFFIVL